MACPKLELQLPLMYNEPRTVRNKSWPRYNLPRSWSSHKAEQVYELEDIFPPPFTVVPRSFLHRPRGTVCRRSRDLEEARRENVSR